MPPSSKPIIDQMQARLQPWQAASDDKALFLHCYLLMTSNVLAAVEQDQFHDPDWVTQLLHRFAGYYFDALARFEEDPAAAPAVWQVAHNAASDPKVTPLQKLLLGVNAHINYDLVLTLVDMLQGEWPQLTAEQRNGRYQDHCHINQIIGHTIDAVQDTILEPAMPVMDLLDKLLGPVDEMLILHLITDWREDVWQNAAQLLQIDDPQTKAQFIKKVESATLSTGSLICRQARTKLA